jgi:hypothetical protein
MAGLWLFFQRPDGGGIRGDGSGHAGVAHRIGICARRLSGRQGTVSWYQAAFGCRHRVRCVILAAWLGDVPSRFAGFALRGIRLLWQPGVILCLQGLWLGIFVFTGRSRVTTATLSLHVVKDQI